MSGTRPERKEPLYYGDYLQLSKLLDAQELESTKAGETAHDEMLFIVVHQAFELWFKLILWELDALKNLFEKGTVAEKELGRGVAHLERIVEIQRLFSTHIDILETMTPLDFLDFRDLLVPASGFQSFQWRQIEMRLGLRREDRIDFDGQKFELKLRPEEQEILTYAYSSIAKELDAILVPVGLVWNQLRTNNQFNFYVADGSHPSPMGSYLAASTIFSTLFEVSPIGLSGHISGKDLSSSGVPSMDSQVLTELKNADAQAIQKASWSVVETLQKSGGYPNVKRPKPSYQIPVLAEGENIDLKKIEGKWYGTSTYGFNYLGFILDIKTVNDDLETSLTFYSPDRKDQMTVQEAKISDNQLVLKIIDSLRTLNPTLRFSLKDDQMTGLLESEGATAIAKRPS